MMFKRNDGYALSYVLVVLLVLAIIATAVMAPPLRNLQMQQASIERMQEKYAAQGMVEQVVAELQATGITNSSLYNSTDRIISATNGNTTITAKVLLAYNGDGTYTVTYESYEISYNTEVGS